MTEPVLEYSLCHAALALGQRQKHRELRLQISGKVRIWTSLNIDW